MIESRDGRRVVITGVGVVASCGVGATAFWAGLRRPPRPATLRPVLGFDPEQFGLRRVDARRLDRFAQFAVVAGTEALIDAAFLTEPGAAGRLTGVDPERTGVLVGSGIGGAMTWEEQATLLRDKGERAVSPLTVPMVMPNAAAAALSLRWSLHGPCETMATSCATGTHSIGNAARWVAAGRCDVAIAGGAESA